MRPVIWRSSITPAARFPASPASPNRSEPYPDRPVRSQSDYYDDNRRTGAALSLVACATRAIEALVPLSELRTHE